EECSTLILSTRESYRVLIALLAFTGLRISEALGLLWENVDLTNGVLHVEAQLARKKRGEPVKRKALKGARRKGGERREVDLVPELVKLIKRHKADAFANGYAGRRLRLLHVARHTAHVQERARPCVYPRRQSGRAES